MVVSEVREDSVEIFCSYAHEDEPLRQEFETSVALMRRKKQIEVWHDRQIMAGDRWRDDLDEHLNSADIITLFVSRDFLASDYCYEKELTRALEREAAKDAVVVPIIVRDCDWSDAPFRYLQGIPSGKAVTSWANRDEAWTAVAKALKLIVLDLLKKKKEKAEALAAAVPPPPVQASAPARLLPMEEALDRQRAQEIYAGILKDAAQGQMERWRVVQELQTKIFSLEQDLGGSGLPRPKKRASDAYNAMDAYIRDLDK